MNANHVDFLPMQQHRSQAIATPSLQRPTNCPLYQGEVDRSARGRAHGSSQGLGGGEEKKKERHQNIKPILVSLPCSSWIGNYPLGHKKIEGYVPKRERERKKKTTMESERPSPRRKVKSR